MTKTLLRAGALSCGRSSKDNLASRLGRRQRPALACGLALLATTALTTPAFAQTAQPLHRTVDGNGVDLTNGDFVLSLPEGSIGSGQGQLTLVRKGGGTNASGWDNISLVEGASLISVQLGDHWETFNGTGASNQGNGATLSHPSGAYVHTAADGTAITFSPVDSTCTPSSTPCSWIAESVATPDGRSVHLIWDQWLSCDNSGLICSLDYARLAAVRNGYDYEIGFNYSSGGSSGVGPPPSSWFQRTSADFYNSAVSTSPQASVSYAYPSSGVTEITDMGGRVWRVADSGGKVTGIRRPGASSDTTTIGYVSGTGVVNSVTNEGVTTSYSRSVSGPRPRRSPTPRAMSPPSSRT